MGIKAIARPLNKAKNHFIKWLNRNKAENVDIFYGDNTDTNWDYYCVVSGFVNDFLYTVSFEMWNGQKKISYSDESNRHENLTIEELYNMID